MSATAFKRDLADPKTIEDFAAAVQSPERLRLLLMLTVVDIRAVGPSTWNEWKRQLLRSLFDAAEERLRLGHKQRGRTEEVKERQADLAGALGWPSGAAKAHARRLPDSYWLAEPPAWQVANARQVAEAESRIGDPEPAWSPPTSPGAERRGSASSRPTGRAVLPYLRRAGGGRGSIVDARIHTTRDGMALDNLLVPDSPRPGLCRPAAADAAGEGGRSGAARTRCRRRSAAGDAAAAARRLQVAPSVVIAEQASITNDGGRGQRPRPRRPAGAPGAGHSRPGPAGPFGPHRHLWRTRGRRFLPDQSDGPKLNPANRTHCVRRCWPPPANRKAAAGPPDHKKRPRPCGEASPFDCSRLAAFRLPAAAAAAAAAPGRRRPKRITVPSAQVWVAGGGGGGGGGSRFDDGAPGRGRTCRERSGRRCAAHQGTRRTAAARAGIVVGELQKPRRASSDRPGPACRTRPACTWC